jgi:hypothetical protein
MLFVLQSNCSTFKHVLSNAYVSIIKLIWDVLTFTRFVHHRFCRCFSCAVVFWHEAPQQRICAYLVYNDRIR